MGDHVINDRAVRYGIRHHRGDPDTYTEEEVAFMCAMEKYVRLNRRPFPTYAEVFAVAIAMGYRKVKAKP